MGRNKKLRKRLARLEAVLAEHHEKIATELRRPRPNVERIRYWEREIVGRTKEIDRLRAKLPGGRG